MGRFEAYQGLIEYYKDAHRMCEEFCPKCEKCPMHVILDDGAEGCGRSILSFNINNEIETGKALYKMYVVGKWADEHPEVKE